MKVHGRSSDKPQLNWLQPNQRLFLGGLGGQHDTNNDHNMPCRDLAFCSRQNPQEFREGAMKSPCAGPVPGEPFQVWSLQTPQTDKSSKASLQTPTRAWGDAIKQSPAEKGHTSFQGDPSKGYPSMPGGILAHSDL